MERIKKAVEKLDALVNFEDIAKRLSQKAGIWAKTVASLAGNQLEKRDEGLFIALIEEGYDKLPTIYHPDLDAVLDAFNENDPTLLDDILVDRLVGAINTPYGDEVELIVIAPQVQMAVNLMVYYAKR